ncbi:MAG: hypothetical protein ABFE01_23520 [Phycisphaerales bacterium]
MFNDAWDQRGNAVQGSPDRLESAMRMLDRARHILLATVDETGTPLLTPVESCTPAGERSLRIEAWIEVPPQEDPGGRSRMTLLFWDEHGAGYQLTGHTIRSYDTAMLDGLTEIEDQAHFPQVERDILMQVESVEEFHFVESPLAHG